MTRVPAEAAMSRAAVLFPLLLLQAPVGRPGPPVKQAVRSGDLGPWQYEDFRETYLSSRDLTRRRHPVNGVSYVGEGLRWGVMQGQTVFRRRQGPLWLVHNFYCTQPAMTAEVPWDCAGIAFVLQGTVALPPGQARQEDGFTLVNAEQEVRIEGDFEAIEPHPDLPIFAAIRYGCCDSPARVSVHHFDGRTLCEPRALRLEDERWRGEPWASIKVDAKAVFCLDGTRVPLVSPAIQAFGAWDGFRFTEEHQYGHGLELWRLGEELVGFLLVADGLQGDTPTGLLEDVTYDARTGRLSFGARLTRGSHTCRRHRDVPSRDVYRFEGVLRSGRIEGELTNTDALHPGREPSAGRVVLEMRQETLQRFANVAEWQQHAQLLLALRGPRW